MSAFGLLLRSKFTLGQILNLQELSRLNEKKSKAGRASEQEVREMFEFVKSTVEDMINQDQPIEAIKLSTKFPFNPEERITDSGHPFHSVYQEFAAWCQENDLKATFAITKDVGTSMPYPEAVIESVFDLNTEEFAGRVENLLSPLVPESKIRNPFRNSKKTSIVIDTAGETEEIG